MTFTGWGQVPSDFIKWESNPNYTRIEGTILAGSGADRELLSGQLLGEVKSITVTAGTNIGDGTLDQAYASHFAKEGIYTITCVLDALTAPTTVSGSEIFSVVDPTGRIIGRAVTGAAPGGADFVSTEIGFTLTDGVADFVIGDSFTITVEKGEWVRIDWAGTDGSQIPGGILLLDATAPDGVNGAGTILVQGPAIINDSYVDYNAGTDAQILNAQQILTLAGIIIEVSA
jgi:hypothetical protein